MNPLLRERHRIAIDILARLNLDNVRIEQAPDGRYFVWRAWTPAIPIRNGHEQTKHGRVRVPIGK